MRHLRHLGGSRDQSTCPYPAIIQDKIVMPAYTWYAGLALVWLMDAGVHACTGFAFVMSAKVCRLDPTRSHPPDNDRH